MARVHCTTCDREQDVDGANAIVTGWPTCHGQTMRLVTGTLSDDELELGVEKAFGPAYAARDAAAKIGGAGDA